MVDITSTMALYLVVTLFLFAFCVFVRENIPWENNTIEKSQADKGIAH